MSAEERNVEQPELSPELKSLEAALGTFVPRPAPCDRDRLMFEAGWQAAVRSEARPLRRWMWPALTAGMAAAAAVLLLAVLLRPEPQVAERIVYVPMNSQPAVAQGEPSRGNWTQREADRAAASQRDMHARAAAAAVPRLSVPYLDLRDRLVGHAVDGWPSPAKDATARGLPASPASYADLRDELLGSPSVQPYL